jgi:hypothetical protein
MSQTAQNIRGMMKLAGDLRRLAGEAVVPIYEKRLLTAAAEVEAQAHLAAEHLDDSDYDLSQEIRLHRHVDMKA